MDRQSVASERMRALTRVSSLHVRRRSYFFPPQDDKAIIQFMTPLLDQHVEAGKSGKPENKFMSLSVFAMYVESRVGCPSARQRRVGKATDSPMCRSAQWAPYGPPSSSILSILFGTPWHSVTGRCGEMLRTKGTFSCRHAPATQHVPDGRQRNGPRVPQGCAANPGAGRDEQL